MKLRPFLHTAAVAAALCVSVFAPSVRANVLVYEGFHPADYNNVSASGNVTASDPTPTGTNTIGVSTAKWNAMGGSQIKVFGENYGLALPAEMTDAGYVAQGGSIGLNPASEKAQHRAMSHNLTANTLNVSSGTLYVRMLLNLDSTAAKKLSAGASLAQKDGGYFGFGLGKSPSGNDYYAPTHLQSAISFVIWKNSSNQYVLSFVHTTAAGTTFTDYPIITGITLGTTYICYAEVQVGAGADGKEIVRAGAMAVDAYTTSTPWAELANGSDSVEVELITDSSYPTCMAVAGPYGTKDGSTPGYFRADEIVVGTEIEDILSPSTTMPVLSDGSLSLSGGTYTASASLAQSAANMTYTLSDGDDATTETPVALGSGSFAADSTATGTFSAPTDNTTYEVILTAENAGGETAELSLGTIYGGTLALAKVSDGSELGLVPATLTVSRLNPDPLPLVVNYAFADGTAVAGVNYVDDAGSVTIPAGETSATISVRPLVDASTDTDTSLTVSITAGNYAAPVGVAVTIATPAGCNYWLGGTATDGNNLASTAENWTAGHAPLAGENVIFDGTVSTADCEWDAAATATVATWTMQNGYTGVVTLDTVYPGKGDFQCLTVVGAMDVQSGTITHPQSRIQWQSASNYLQDLIDNETYRIRIDAGSLTVGASGRIDARNKGYYHANTGNHTCPEPSHGGRLSATGQAPYDDPKEPIHIGMAYKRSSGGYYIGIGGGAIYLTSDGDIVVDGFIGADTGSDTWNRGYTLRNGAAAGSVYVRGASVTGTGTISASAVQTAEQNYRGVGGRVAVIATSQTPIDYTNLTLKASVYPFKSDGTSISTTFGGCGTVFVKDGTMTNGVLIVRSFDMTYNDAVRRNRTTEVTPDVDWSFDRIELGGNVQLVVPADTTLTLPGWDSITAPYNASGTPSGLYYRGGTLNFGSATDVTLSGHWYFAPVSNYVFNANVSLADGAGIGFGGKYTQQLSSNAYPDALDAIHCTVNGDLTVPAGCAVNVIKAGAMQDSNYIPAGYPMGVNGGRRSNTMATIGSVFRPRTLPHGQSNSYGHIIPGGAVELLVTGTFTLGGNIAATPYDGNDGINSQVGGGSIDVTAGRLVGDGAIKAGAVKNGQPGGRIAIRLTGSGATLDDFSGTVNCSTMGSGSIGSCGSIYVQNAGVPEGRGTVVLDDNNVTCTTYTPICATGYQADNTADFKYADLVVRNEAKAQVTAADENGDFRMDEIEIGETGELDLFGHAFTVTTASVGGRKVKTGTYTAAQLQELGFDGVVDTADGAGGQLIVRGATTVLMLQ